MSLFYSPHSPRYYYNSVTKRSSWTPPRFSASWQADKAQKATHRRGTAHFRRKSTWAAQLHGDAGRSGFRPLFGPGAFAKPDHAARGSSGSASWSSGPGGDPVAGFGGDWDGSFLRDPSVILGGWTVDGVDEVLN